MLEHGSSIDNPPPAQTSDTEIIDIPSFSEFDLDLSCLSTASSPPGSDFGGDSRIPSPTASPSTIHRPLSIGSLSFNLESCPRSVSPKSSPSVRTVRGSSLPFTSRLGRGTPVDKSRRFEWGGRGHGGESSEHGILLSGPRSTSLDERRPRPLSPEWTLLTEALLNARAVTLHRRTRSRSIIVDNSPALRLEGFCTEDTSDWASSTMKTVLDSTVDIRLDDSAVPSSPPLVSMSDSSEVETQPIDDTQNLNEAGLSAAFVVTPGEPAELANAELEMDLGLDSPLDLELKVLEPEAEDARFHASMLREDLGRGSPSIYSTPPPSPKHQSQSSFTRNDAEDFVGDPNVTSTPPLSWWRRLLRRIRKATFLAGHHTNP